MGTRVACSEMQECGLIFAGCELARDGSCYGTEIFIERRGNWAYFVARWVTVGVVKGLSDLGSDDNQNKNNADDNNNTGTSTSPDRCF